jgi:hypothetical protein
MISEYQVSLNQLKARSMIVSWLSKHGPTQWKEVNRQLKIRGLNNTIAKIAAWALIDNNIIRWNSDNTLELTGEFVWEDDTYG